MVSWNTKGMYIKIAYAYDGGGIYNAVKGVSGDFRKGNYKFAADIGNHITV